jgi:hypothetical protein
VSQFVRLGIERGDGAVWAVTITPSDLVNRARYPTPCKDASFQCLINSISGCGEPKTGLLFSRWLISLSRGWKVFGLVKVLGLTRDGSVE